MSHYAGLVSSLNVSFRQFIISVLRVFIQFLFITIWKRQNIKAFLTSQMKHSNSGWGHPWGSTVKDIVVTLDFEEKQAKVFKDRSSEAHDEEGWGDHDPAIAVIRWVAQVPLHAESASRLSPSVKYYQRISTLRYVTLYQCYFSIIYLSAVKRLIAINRIQNKKNLFT